MSRPDVGILVPIADLSQAFWGLKIRTVGSLSYYAAKSGRGRLTSGRASLQVDFSLASESLRMGSLPIQSKLLVIGSMEREETGEDLLLIAIHIAIVDNLDLGMWEQSARELSRALHHRSVQDAKV